MSAAGTYIVTLDGFHSHSPDLRHTYEGDIKVLGAGDPGRPAVRSELGRERTHLEVQSSLYQHPRSHAQVVEIWNR